MSVCVFYPGFSELGGSGSQFSYILPQKCLQLNRQTQERILQRLYGEAGKEVHVLQKSTDKTLN